MSEEPQDEQRSTGTIVTLFRDRDFGFIAPTGGGQKDTYFKGRAAFKARAAEPGVALRRGIVVSYTRQTVHAAALDVIVEDERAADAQASMS